MKSVTTNGLTFRRSDDHLIVTTPKGQYGGNVVTDLEHTVSDRTAPEAIPGKREKRYSPQLRML